MTPEELINAYLKGMKEFGINISTLVNTILLFFTYLIGVGITSIVAKISGKHFMDLRRREGTYWHDINLGKRKKEDYYKQF